MKAEDLVSKGTGLKVWTLEECKSRVYKSINAGESVGAFWERAYTWAYFEREDNPITYLWVRDCIVVLTQAWEEIHGKKLTDTIDYVEVTYGYERA